MKTLVVIGAVASVVGGSSLLLQIIDGAGGGKPHGPSAALAFLSLLGGLALFAGGRFALWLRKA